MPAINCFFPLLKLHIQKGLSFQLQVECQNAFACWEHFNSGAKLKTQNAQKTTNERAPGDPVTCSSGERARAGGVAHLHAIEKRGIKVLDMKRWGAQRTKKKLNKNKQLAVDFSGCM